MSFLKTIRSSIRSGADDEAPAEAGSAAGDEAFTDRYRKLNERQAVAALGGLNQVELTAIEQFERSNRGSEDVLNKLRYLRQAEPLRGYDRLTAEAIADALAAADADTIKAVREYERKHQNRPTVNAATATAFQRVRDRPPAGANGSVTAASDEPPVIGNGLPIKVRPETGLGTP